MTAEYHSPLQTTADAHAAFVVFVADHGGISSELAVNAFCNAFSAETHDEYADDLHRWTVALATAKEYADEGVTGY